MQDAGKFFYENQCLFTNPAGKAMEQEKFNLYGGLLTMAENIEELDRSIKDMLVKINNIEMKLNGLGLFNVGP